MTKQYEPFEKLVWLDLEMTGLDPSVNRIIEAAVLVTDADLNILGEGLSLVIHQPEDVLAASNEFVLKTFGESGLFDKVRESTLSATDAQEQILAYIKKYGVTQGTALLSGNSVGNDRMFVIPEMPQLQAWLHYRNIDVSTVKMLTRTWLPEIFRDVPVKAESHQAFADIQESIEELKFYKQRIFDPLAVKPAA